MKQKRPPLFERLRSGLEDLREYARGERELVETELTSPAPPRCYAAADVTALRNQLGLSQSRLALLMHVSIKTIHETGSKESGRHPALLLGYFRFWSLRRPLSIPFRELVPSVVQLLAKPVQLDYTPTPRQATWGFSSG